MRKKAKKIPPPHWLQAKAVDNCALNFSELASSRLPILFQKLQNQIKTSVPLRTFFAKSVGPAGLAQDEAITEHLSDLTNELIDAKGHTAQLRQAKHGSGSSHDFAGVYVFVSSNGAFYVGITRTVFRRVQSHVRNLTHNTASLLFNMVRDYSGNDGPRSKLDLSSLDAGKIQEWLQGQKVAILPLACPVERYALELYAAMELKTGQWNTFETH